MSPYRPASPQPPPCWRGWLVPCSIRPIGTMTVLSPKGARCSRPGCRALKTPPSAARSACCWATISARCASSSTPRPMSSNRSIAMTVSACGISAKTRPRPARPLDLAVDAARVEQRDDPDQTSHRSDMMEDDSKLGRARPVAPDQRGIVIAKYPEWDRAHGIERPEWTTVREVAARPGDPRLVEEALDRADVLRNRIRRLVRGVRVGRTIRLKRQLDGHDLDVDAMLEAGIALRMRQEPDPRVFPHHHLEASRSCGAAAARHFANRPATVWPPAPPFSMSNALRLRCWPKP